MAVQLKCRAEAGCKMKDHLEASIDLRMNSVVSCDTNSNQFDQNPSHRTPSSCNLELVRKLLVAYIAGTEAWGQILGRVASMVGSLPSK